MSEMQPITDAEIRARLQATQVFDRRWEILKSVVVPLFYKEKIKDIAKMMEDRFGFKASEEAYKYRCNRVWSLQKNLPAAVKVKILQRAVARAAQGKLSRARYKGQAVSASRLMPLATPNRSTIAPLTMSQLFEVPLTSIRFFGGYVPFSSNVLLAWNLPFGAKSSTPTSPRYNPSPRADGQGLSDIEMTTPSDSAASPAAVAMVPGGCNTLALTVREERAKLFLAGNFNALMATMAVDEQKVLSTYLHRLWYFGFVAAQTWSTGSPRMSAADLGFSETHGSFPAVHSPTHDILRRSGEIVEEQILPPPACKRTIHLRCPEDLFESTNDQPLFLQTEHRAEPKESFNEELCNVLRTDAFGEMDPSSLPMSISSLANKIPKTSADLLPEAVAFAVMGRNVDLLDDLLGKVLKEGIKLAPSHLLHLATSYLDGGSTCCLLLDRLLPFHHSRSEIINEHGHTVLDNLLLNILRSHTNTPIYVVDCDLGQQARYAGQEVDICGRWSADSPCFQSLVASGEVNVPSSWKHKLCHTSTQSICHAARLLLLKFSPSFFMKSGLFRRRCPSADCAKLLEIGPFHALVITAHYVATRGCEGEDLFGVLALYLTLVHSRLDPGLLSVEISVDLVLGMNESEICTHRLLSPAQLARELQCRHGSGNLPQEICDAWATLVAVMEVVEHTNASDDDVSSPLNSDGEDEDAVDQFYDSDMDVNHIVQSLETRAQARENIWSSFPRPCEFDACFSYDEIPRDWDLILGHVYAAIQAELVSPPFNSDGCSSLSEHFSMKRVLRLIETNNKRHVGHLIKPDLKPYCVCGNFDADESIFTGGFSPQDIFEAFTKCLGSDPNVWARTTFVGIPEVDYE